MRRSQLARGLQSRPLSRLVGCAAGCSLACGRENPTSSPLNDSNLPSTRPPSLTHEKNEGLVCLGDLSGGRWSGDEQHPRPPYCSHVLSYAFTRSQFKAVLLLAQPKPLLSQEAPVSTFPLRRTKSPAHSVLLFTTDRLESAR